MGDIVEVKSGDRLPADIRIIKSAGFKVLAVLASKEIPVNKQNDHSYTSVDSEAYIILSMCLCTYLMWFDFLCIQL